MKWRLVLFANAKKAILLLLLVLIAGCVHIPGPQEQEDERRRAAEETVRAIKPGAEIDILEPLTLQKVITIGLRNNLKLRVDRFNREVADYESLAQKLKMLPRVSADVNWTYRDELRKSDVYDWALDEDVEDTTVSELKDSAKADLRLTFNILDFMIASVRSGQMEMKELVLDRRMARQEQTLALEIVEAYWKAVAVEDALDYVHDVEKELKQVKKRIDQSVKERVMDRMDAADIELRLKELELTIRHLQANLSSARLKLSQLMGFDQNVQYTLARPPLKPVVQALPHAKELEIDQLEEYALLHRPELFESDLNVLIQKQEAKTEFLSMFPGVNVFAATHYDDNRLLLSNTWNSVGAGIGWQLLDLPFRYARYKGSKKAIDMAKEQRLMTTVGVITQVHIALLDYAIKLDRFRLLEETYQLSHELYDLAKDKRKIGKMRDVDVTQRNLENMAAKLRRDEAIVDLIVAHKRLCVSMGVAPLDCGKNLMQPGSDDGYRFSQPASRTDSWENMTDTKKWRCSRCGYVATGPEPPDVCPVCGAPASEFIEIPAGDQIEEGDLSGMGGSYEWEEAGLTQPMGGMSRGASSPGFAGDASDRFLWKVQLGAFSKHGGADERIDQIKDLDLRLLDDRDAQVTTTRIFGKLYNRVRIVGLTEAHAKQLVNDLKRRNMEYWILPPGSMHWE